MTLAGELDSSIIVSLSLSRKATIRGAAPLLLWGHIVAISREFWLFVDGDTRVIISTATVRAVGRWSTARPKGMDEPIDTIRHASSY